MTEFFLSLAAFLASHTLPEATGAKAALVGWIGRRAYLALYSGLSLALLAWLVSAALRAPYVALWPPGALTDLAPILAMPPALFLFVSGAGRPNPLSVSFLSGAPDLTDPGALAITRHPILWAFALWAGGHAVANGDLVGLMLFGGLAAFSLVGMKILDRRARKRLSIDEWIRARSPSAGPKTVRLNRFPTPRVAVEAVVALLLYVLLLWAHPHLFGPDPLARFG